MQAKELKESFTKRYVLAITIIAILSTIAFFTLHYALKMSDSTPLHVTMAGKQQIALTVWILTCLTLLLEVIFIFRPMNKKIEELFDELILNDKNLEVEIERRTLNLEQTNAKLQMLASHDPLTGLKNRLNLERDLESLLFHFKEHHYPFAVAMIDIDWFKKINDNYGHDIGDKVLKELSFLITNAIRSEDSAYRAGGEEFVIIFNRISSTQAIEKMESLRQMVEKYSFESDGITMHLTISGGLYHPDWIKVDRVQNILKLSDEALYQAKHLGRNKVVAAHRSNTTLYTPLAPAKSVMKIQRNDLTKIVYADFDIITILGYENDAFIEGKITFREILHPDDIDFFERLCETEPFMTTLRIRHADGNIKIIKIECTLVDNLWKFEIQDPIALAKSVEESMIVHNFDAMMNNSDDFIYFKDRYHVFTAGSKTLVSLTNVNSRDEFVGKTDYEVFPSEYADKYFKLEKEVFSGEIEVAREVQPILDNNGHPGWVDNRKYPIKNDAGEIVGLFGIARIISQPISLK